MFRSPTHRPRPTQSPSYFAFLSSVFSLCILFSGSIANATDLGDDPNIEVEAIELSGGFEMIQIDPEGMPQTKEIGATQIRISFEPFVKWLPTSITIDLEKNNISQMDMELLRTGIFSVLTYHRDLWGHIKNSIGAFKITYPFLQEDFGGCPPEEYDCRPADVQGKIVIAVGGEIGWRWMTTKLNGAFFEPKLSMAAIVTFMNRIFAGIDGSYGYTMMTGFQSSYDQGSLLARIGFSLNDRDTMRLMLVGGLQYYGVNDQMGLPAYSKYLGARFEWNFGGL